MSLLRAIIGGLLMITALPVVSKAEAASSATAASVVCSIWSWKVASACPRLDADCARRLQFADALMREVCCPSIDGAADESLDFDVCVHPSEVLFSDLF